MAWIRLLSRPADSKEWNRKLENALVRKLFVTDEATLKVAVQILKRAPVIVKRKVVLLKRSLVLSWDSSKVP